MPYGFENWHNNIFCLYSMLCIFLLLFRFIPIWLDKYTPLKHIVYFVSTKNLQKKTQCSGLFDTRNWGQLWCILIGIYQLTVSVGVNIDFERTLNSLHLPFTHPYYGHGTCSNLQYIVVYDGKIIIILNISFKFTPPI